MEEKQLLYFSRHSVYPNKWSISRCLGEGINLEMNDRPARKIHLKLLFLYILEKLIFLLVDTDLHVTH